MVGSPAEITVTLFQSVELRVMVAPSSLHDGSLLFPASNIADFDIPETKYRHALPLPLQSIMTSATARVAELNAMLTVPFSLDMSWESRDTECYCGVRYFQLSQLVELRRIRIATFPPNEKANCAEYVAPGFCCITSAALLPKSLGSPFGLTVVANIMQFGGLSMSVTSVAYSLDTECSYTFALIFTAST